MSQLEDNAKASLNPPSDNRSGNGSENPFEAIAQALAGLKFGAILLTVHEGRLVQMDVTEKRRFSA